MREDMPAGLALAGESLKALFEVTKRLSEVELQRTDLVPYGYAFSGARADREDARSETARKRAGSTSNSGIAP